MNIHKMWFLFHLRGITALIVLWQKAVLNTKPSLKPDRPSSESDTQTASASIYHSGVNSKHSVSAGLYYFKV